ncbi:MAG TPA: carboxypeptidase-like regulatory domain-containing protein [Terriglobales bacterium]|nr:carboxypeptidase-like regulatory domain-containing protein [Terriglobales bacterium]
MNRSRRSILLCLVGLLLIFVMTSSGSAAGATLRGRIQRVLPNGAAVPLPGVAVTVYNQSLGRSSPAYSAADGMYYLSLRPGMYYLEIWRGQGLPPMVYQIQVVEPVTDIPPINL